MNVQVTEWYVPSCGDCITIIENLVSSAVRDADVTKLSIAAGHRHCHNVPEKAKRIGPGADAPGAAGVAGASVPSLDLFQTINGPDAPTTTSGVPNGLDVNL